MFISLTSISIFPKPWTSSTWKYALESFTNSPISFNGIIDPTSLLTAIIETKIVSGVNSLFKSSKLIWPVSSTSRYTILYPSWAKRFIGFMTEGCSILVVIIFLPISFLARTVPKIAVLLLSEPPLVKIISLSWALIVSASWWRAVSTTWRALRPNACWLEALPKSSAISLLIFSITFGSIGVVAALSKYTFFLVILS